MQFRFTRHIKTIGKITLPALQLIAAHAKSDNKIACRFGSAAGGFPSLIGAEMTNAGDNAFGDNPKFAFAVTGGLFNGGQILLPSGQITAPAEIR